jgi:hypothetical protein
MQTGARAEVRADERQPAAKAPAPSAAQGYAAACGNAAFARTIARQGDEKKEEEQDTPESRATKAASKAMPANLGTIAGVLFGQQLPGVSKTVSENTKLLQADFRKSLPAVIIPIFPPLVMLSFGGGVNASVKATGGYVASFTREAAPMANPFGVVDRLKASGAIDFKASAAGSVWTELGANVGFASAGARATAGLEADGEGAVRVNGDIVRSGNDPDKDDMRQFEQKLNWNVNFKGDLWAKAKVGFNATLRTPIEDEEKEAVVGIGKWQIGWFQVTGNGSVNVNTGETTATIKFTGDFGQRPEHTAEKRKLDSRVQGLGPQYALNEPETGPGAAPGDGEPPPGEGDATGQGSPAAAVA